MSRDAEHPHRMGKRRVWGERALLSCRVSAPPCPGLPLGGWGVVGAQIFWDESWKEQRAGMESGTC